MRKTVFMLQELIKSKIKIFSQAKNEIKSLINDKRPFELHLKNEEGLVEDIPLFKMYNQEKNETNGSVEDIRSLETYNQANSKEFGI